MGVKNFTTRLMQMALMSCAACLLHLDLTAQVATVTSQGASQSKFEIVSLHPSKEDDTRPEHIDNPYKRGYLKAVNVNLRSLMEIAYDIPDLRMFGGASWVTSDKFSIEAKADSKIDEQLAALPMVKAKQAKREMIAALLVDRFKLSVHADTKQMSAYALVIGKDGPKLAGSRQSDDLHPAGDQIIDISPGSDSLQILAYELSWRVGRPVLDKTGLQDKQALTLRWRGDEEASVDSNAPSLFTAIQEQVGLKLDPTKGSVPVLLIDHAERPTEE